jgi:hypothetical protein
MFLMEEQDVYFTSSTFHSNVQIPFCFSSTQKVAYFEAAEWPRGINNPIPSLESPPQANHPSAIVGYNTPVLFLLSSY